MLFSATYCLQSHGTGQLFLRFCVMIYGNHMYVHAHVHHASIDSGLLQTCSAFLTGMHGRSRRGQPVAAIGSLALCRFVAVRGFTCICRSPCIA